MRNETLASDNGNRFDKRDCQSVCFRINKWQFSKTRTTHCEWMSQGSDIEWILDLTLKLRERTE